MECEECQFALGLAKTALVAIATTWSVSTMLDLLAESASRSAGYMPEPAPDEDISESEEEEDEERCPFAELFPIDDAEHDVSAELGQAFSVWTGAASAIVCYSAEQTAFLYWCDTTMPWPALEAMARQYVTEHRCRDLYVALGTVAAAAVRGATDTESDEAETPEEEAPSVVTKPSNNYLRMGRLHAYRTRTADAGRDEHLTYDRFKIMSGTGHFTAGGR